MAEALQTWIKTKFKGLKYGKSAILLKKFDFGAMIIEPKDFVEMLEWIHKGKVVEETIVGYNEDGSPIVQRTERDPTPEEVKKRWLDSGYVELFEEWLADGIITVSDLKVLFGSEKPWL
ncbi:MAG: hypothetical protein QXJ31_01980 [Candidatus Bathyarchaeia archaeon]